MAKDNSLFVAAHPAFAADIAAKHGGLDWINKWTDERNGRIVEAWERNADGVLVNVTEKYKAMEELERAKKELAKLAKLGGEN